MRIKPASRVSDKGLTAGNSRRICAAFGMDRRQKKAGLAPGFYCYHLSGGSGSGGL